MTTISFKAPEALRRDVEEAASTRGVSNSAIIRESLERTLRHGKKKIKKVTCLELIGDLVGHFEGPPDLSTNRKYLTEAVLADHRRGRKNRH